MKYSVLKTKSWQHVLASLLFAAIGLGVGQSRASAIDLGGLRTGHTATLLTSGQVLIAGGNNETDFLSSAELYDPVTRNVTAVGAMTTARANHTATLLRNGRVLIAGGDQNGVVLDTAEIYDPKRRTFRALASVMSTSRNKHTATVLRDGRVLLAGGSRADLYDPATNSFTGTTGTPVDRKNHAATLLASGKVLITGGYVSAQCHLAQAE